MFLCCHFEISHVIPANQTRIAHVHILSHTCIFLFISAHDVVLHDMFTLKPHGVHLLCIKLSLVIGELCLAQNSDTLLGLLAPGLTIAIVTRQEGIFFASKHMWEIYQSVRNTLSAPKTLGTCIKFSHV